MSEPERILPHVPNEYGPLKKLVVCWGTSIPEHARYQTQDPEFHKFHTLDSAWDRDLYLKQQEAFFEVLEKTGVHLFYAKPTERLIWQAYVRDTAFVLGETLYHSVERRFVERENEIDAWQHVLDRIPADRQRSLPTGWIEGGDVLAGDTPWVGHSSRTSQRGLDTLKAEVNILPLQLGQNVMHLDTRLTRLSDKHLLIEPKSFPQNDLNLLAERHTLLEVTQEEAESLGTNVFMINPEKVVVEAQHTRIHGMLRDAGFDVIPLAYSEPIRLGGSFRCTTCPLEREA